MNGYFSVTFIWGLLLKYWLDCHIILVYDAILDWSNTQAYSQCITLLNYWWHIFFTIHVYNFIYDIHTMSVHVYSMTQRTLHKALCSFTAMRQSHTMVLACPGACMAAVFVRVESAYVMADNHDCTCNFHESWRLGSSLFSDYQHNIYWCFLNKKMVMEIKVRKSQSIPQPHRECSFHLNSCIDIWWYTTDSWYAEYLSNKTTYIQRTARLHFISAMILKEIIRGWCY